MSESKSERGFDVLAFKDRVQAQIYEEIKDLSPEEEIAYWRRSVEMGPFAEFWKRIGQVKAARENARPLGE
jgi:hypothetical protein